MVLGPADSVSRKNGRIEESRDGGESWALASGGLDLPWPDRMVERFVQDDGRLFAITNDGRLYETSGETLEWGRILPEVLGINALACDPSR